MRVVYWIGLVIAAVVVAAFLWFREAMDILPQGPLPPLQTGDILFVCKQRIYPGDFFRYMPMSFYMRTGFLHAGIIVGDDIYHLTQPDDQYHLHGLTNNYIHPDGPQRGGIQRHKVADYLRAYEATHTPLWMLYRQRHTVSPDGSKGVPDAPDENAWRAAIERFRDYGYTCEGRIFSMISAFLFRPMDTASREFQCCSFVGCVLEELRLVPPAVAPIADYIPAKLQSAIQESGAFTLEGVYTTPEEYQCWCKRQRFHVVL